MGKYKDMVDAQRKSMTPNQIHKMKCQRSRENNLRLKEENIKKMLEQQQAWQALSPQEQLKSLDYRLGKGKGAVKQRKRIMAKLEAEKRNA